MCTCRLEEKVDRLALQLAQFTEEIRIGRNGHANGGHVDLLSGARNSRGAWAQTQTAIGGRHVVQPEATLNVLHPDYREWKVPDIAVS